MSWIIFPKCDTDDIRKKPHDLRNPLHKTKADHAEGRIIADGNSFDDVKAED